MWYNFWSVNRNYIHTGSTLTYSFQLIAERAATQPLVLAPKLLRLLCVPRLFVPALVRPPRFALARDLRLPLPPPLPSRFPRTLAVVTPSVRQVGLAAKEANGEIAAPNTLTGMGPCIKPKGYRIDLVQRFYFRLLWKRLSGWIRKVQQRVFVCSIVFCILYPGCIIFDRFLDYCNFVLDCFFNCREPDVKPDCIIVIRGRLFNKR